MEQTNKGQVAGLIASRRMCCLWTTIPVTPTKMGRMVEQTRLGVSAGIRAGVPPPGREYRSIKLSSNELHVYKARHHDISEDVCDVRIPIWERDLAQ
jgi:hypothetical protein